MKKIKYILFSAVIFSFFLITACSTTKSVPADDVYYSVSPHNNTVTVKTKTTTTTTTAQNKGTKQAGTQAYQEGTVENITSSSGQTKTADKADDYDVDYAARLKRFHDSGDTTLDYYDDYYEGKTMPGESNKNNNQKSSSTSVSTSVSFGLGFDNPYFGSSWSFGFGYPYYGWGLGFGFGWGYPYYGWGYPYYGWGDPFYGWGYFPPYYGYYPPYYGYYPPFYPVYPGYPDAGYRSPVYQPRIARGGGSSVPQRRVAGGSGVYTSPNGKPSTRSTASGTSVLGKRVPVNPEGRNGKMIKPDGTVTRPAGSIRYNADLIKKRSQEIHAQGKLNKPGGSVVRNGGTVRKSIDGARSPQFGISESRNRGAEGYHKPPAFRREESMPKPRFEKPKQYRSLESSSPRSSKEFYRAPVRPSRPEYRNSSVSTVHSRPQPSRIQHVYRPSGSHPGVYRSSRPREVKIYNAPARFSSPNTFRVPVRRNSSVSSPVRNFTPPARSISVPVRVNTGSSGGGGGRRSSGSGGIKR